MPAPLRREQREQIIALKRSGYKVTEIKRWTGVSRKCIYFWLQRWEESGDISAHHRAVYQRATTAEQDAAIVAAHEANPFKPTRETSLEYSVRTVTLNARRRASGASGAAAAAAERQIPRFVTETIFVRSTRFRLG
ncbi:hypothetical protein ABMA27_010315 [Loxostege sticticalis]|uniref:Insertion element IS150 protein InsJ-like helix-turn-helix domain-containing protein n=1 Tax=Loxostege sticticalis TaxID=481309 RepID=A0ABR3H0Q0_LOXSC